MRALESGGLPKQFAEIIAMWDAAAKRGDLFTSERFLTEILDRPTTPLRESVRAMQPQKSQ